MTDINVGTIARYCKPSTLDEQGKSTGSSFQLRLPNEKYLSVHLLDYFNQALERNNVSEVKNEMQRKGFSFKKTGVFVTLDIEKSKHYVAELISETISYKELGLPHCGLFHNNDDLLISELLAQCVNGHYSVTQI
ncbi:MAG: hypothetical protein GQ547_02270 [Methylophaga sp.]|nr:hypothetical protein [Methylophaga sp.]